jgi:hypothetical protein
MRYNCMLQRGQEIEGQYTQQLADVHANLVSSHQGTNQQIHHARGGG